MLVRALLITTLLALLVPGCRGDLVAGGGSEGSTVGSTSTSTASGSSTETTGAGTTSQGGTSTSPTSGATSGGATDSVSGTSGSSGSGGSTTGAPGPCDPVAQDCGGGQRCIPVDEDQDEELEGGACVEPPTDGGKLAGTQCTRENDDDDCAAGLFCLTGHATAEGDGVCLALCDPGDACDDDSECSAVQGSSYRVCAPECDPLLQDCDEEWGCYGTEGEPEYSCRPVLVQGAPAQPCESPQHCAAGLACVAAGTFSGCTGAACCTEFCMVGDDSPCSTAGSTCLDWTGGTGPGHDDTGACKK